VQDAFADAVPPHDDPMSYGDRVRFSASIPEENRRSMALNDSAKSTDEPAKAVPRRPSATRRSDAPCNR
jgi:hypothetical protein